MKRWGAVVIWCGVIFTFSSIPNLRIEQLGSWDYVLRKISHAAEFAILAILLRRALKEEIRSFSGRNAFWPLFFTFVYAVTDEFHQYYVPGRQTSAVDVLIDTAGGALGLLVYGWIKLRRLNAKR